MRYYKIGLSGEYSQKKGQFGIVNPDREVIRYLIKDGKGYPFSEYSNLNFYWPTDQDSFKVLGDFQITLWTVRLVSDRLKKILEKYSDSSMVYFHPAKVSKEGIDYQYHVLHFNQILDVVDNANSYINSGQPVVVESKLSDIDVFNIDEGFANSFCVSERVQLAMASERVTGYNYYCISKE